MLTFNDKTFTISFTLLQVGTAWVKYLVMLQRLTHCAVKVRYGPRIFTEHYQYQGILLDIKPIQIGEIPKSPQYEIKP